MKHFLDALAVLVMVTFVVGMAVLLAVVAPEILISATGIPLVIWSFIRVRDLLEDFAYRRRKRK
jgi:hypothetical protein